jgi:hypothetical protein
MLQFSLLGTFGLLTSVTCWVFAVILFRVGTRGSEARKLALLLAIEGVTLATSNYVELYLTPAGFASTAYQTYHPISFILHILGDCLMLALYPVFLAAALKTKLARPFATKRVRVVLWGISISCFLVVLLGSPEFGMTLLYLMLALLFVFAFIASVHAWTVAEPGIARTRAGIFAIAFGFRDICWGIVYSFGLTMVYGGTYFAPVSDTLINLIYALGTMLAIPLIAYGILRTHLFDIDLRVRWTIKQSTLAAIVVTIIFVISDGADRYFSSELGDFGGLLAAALVVFFLTPLQNFAERIASAAMPNTENTPEYAAFRKMQVYEAAVDEALEEGGISDKERSLLNRLRDSLGVSESDAESIELEIVNRNASAA